MFTGFTANTRASDCTPRRESAVTHSNRNDKTSENLYWTAPPVETGPIVFRWAVVVRYQASVLNEWYATQTQVIRESKLVRVM